MAAPNFDRRQDKCSEVGSDEGKFRMTTSIYRANDTVYRCTNDTAHLNTAEPQPQSVNIEELKTLNSVEWLRHLTARSQQIVKSAIAEYRAAEAEYKRQFHTERWWEKVPGFELLAGDKRSELAIPRGLLYRLFRRSKNGLNYWLLQHEGMNRSSKINDSKLEHQYAVNLAACALGQGFDEGLNVRYPQTKQLIRARSEERRVGKDQRS